MDIFLTIVLPTTASVLFGGIVTWFFAKRYYVQAGKELIEETEKIRSILRIALLKIENPDAYKVIMKEDGNIGATVSMSATMSKNKSSE